MLVFAAGLLAIGRLALPWLIDSPERVAGWLGERISRSVALDGVKAHWSGPGPVLELEGMRIAATADEPAAITLGRARVQIDVYSWLLPDRHLLSEFVLVDANVDLVRDHSGRIALEGFGSAGKGGLGNWLGRVGHLGLSGGSLRLTDAASGREYSLDEVELRVRQRGDQIVIGVERRVPGSNGGLRAVVELDGALNWPPDAANAYIETQDFPVAQLQPLLETLSIKAQRGLLGGKLWGSWRAGALTSLQGDWELENLVLVAPEFPWGEAGAIVSNVHLPGARVMAVGSGDGRVFNLDLTAGTDPDNLDIRVSAQRRAAEPGGDWRFAAERLPLRLAGAVAQLTAALPPVLRSRLYAAQPQGWLDGLQGEARADGHWQLHGSLTELELRPGAPRWPQVRGLDARFAVDRNGLGLWIDDDALEFAIPGVFKAPVNLSRARALIGAHPGAQGWTLELVGGSLAGKDFAAHLDARVSPDALAGPLLELSAHVPGATILAAKDFWVLHKMPPRTVAWLDRALGPGRVVDGRVIYRGHPSDWPFRAHQGRLEARFAVEGAALDYHEAWPRAENLSVEAAFINSSMLIERASGRIAGARVVRGSGAIASLKDPVLDLDLSGEGDGARWLEFIEATPLRRKHADVLFGMALSGPVEVGARIHLPLRKDLGTSSVAGEALLKGAHFTDSKWNLDFGSVHGRLDFSEGGFSADQLRMQLAGENAELAIAVGAFTSNPARQVEARLQGRASAQALFGQYDQLAAILAQVKGVSEWTVAVDVPKVAEGETPASVIRYSTDLAGTEISFPAPLAKSAESVRRLELGVQLPIESAQPLRLEIGPDVRLFALVGTRDREFRGQLQFGPEAPMDLPAKGLRVSGEVESLNPAAWAGWIMSSAAGDGKDGVLADVALRVGPKSAATQLRLDRSDGPWVLRVEGPDAAGSIRFETGAGRPTALVANFERLHLPEPSGGGSSPLSITPDLIPTLHLWVGDLRIGDARFGEARLEAFSTDTGLRVDLLEAKSKDLEIHAKGDWIGGIGGARSRFEIRMTSEDLGRMLTGLGFAGVIEGGQTLARIDASWAGAPFDFALERLTGAIDVSVGRGRFLDVDPGAGRIFGLLSLRELPRRLTLDFRDLFQSGMSFDRIDGRFALADGNAWTENLTVRSPAADILVIGRTGLASRDYDQQVMVAPHMMSKVLPVLGGLAGGPVGAAAGFLAQGMVAQGSDIEKSSRVHYSVAGSWEKPVVNRLSPARGDHAARRRQAALGPVRPG